MNKKLKGTFGYLNRQKKYSILRTIIYFSLSGAIFIAGVMTTGTRTNLLTVVAVLGCLPACKSTVNMIMFLKSKGCSAEAYHSIEASRSHLLCAYDLYFTSYKNNFAISHLVLFEKTLLGFTEDSKCDTKECEKHLSTMLKQSSFKDYTVSIGSDLSKYCSQLELLAQKETADTENQLQDVLSLLYEISL